jgi:hypothetical protein
MAPSKPQSDHNQLPGILEAPKRCILATIAEKAVEEIFRRGAQKSDDPCFNPYVGRRAAKRGRRSLNNQNHSPRAHD